MQAKFVSQREAATAYRQAASGLGLGDFVDQVEDDDSLEQAQRQVAGALEQVRSGLSNVDPLAVKPELAVAR